MPVPNQTESHRKLSYFSIGWNVGEQQPNNNHPNLDPLLYEGAPKWAKGELVSGFLAGQNFALDRAENKPRAKPTKSVLRK